MPSSRRALVKVKCKQLYPGFELESPIPFLMTINIMLSILPNGSVLAKPIHIGRIWHKASFPSPRLVALPKQKKLLLTICTIQTWIYMLYHKYWALYIHKHSKLYTHARTHIHTHRGCSSNTTNILSCHLCSANELGQMVIVAPSSQRLTIFFFFSYNHDSEWFTSYICHWNCHL